MLATLSNYVKNHEKLLIVILGIILIWFISGKIQDVIARHDDANLAVEKVTLAAQIDKNQALAAQVADQAASYKALADKVASQNQALEQANVALVSALTKQQKADAALDLPALAIRWQQLVPEARPISSQAGLTLDDASAHATVAALEQVPALTQQLVNSQAETKNVNSLLLASNQQVATLNDQVSGLRLEITDSGKVCAAQIKVVKDDARRSKRRWFVAGFIAGLATRLVKF